METTRVTHRLSEPPPTFVVTWYRGTEDYPKHNEAVIDAWGHRVYRRNYRWETLGTDGRYYEIDPPTWWCYTPVAPSWY